MVKNKTAKVLPITIIVLMGAGLRITQIGEQSLWLDEFFSYFLAIKEIPQIIEGTAQDILPPLFYVALHPITIIGKDEIFLRVLSLIFSILNLPILYLLAKEMFSVKIGLAATFLLAVDPLHILYAQEARMYTMLAFLTTLSYYFFWQAWKRDRYLYWFLFTITMTLAFYTHSLAILGLFAVDIFCLIDRKQLKKRYAGLLLSHAAIFVLFLPWLMRMLGQLRYLESEFEGASRSILTILTTPYLFLFSISLRTVVVPFALFASLALIAFSLLGAWHAFRSGIQASKALLFSICIFITPVVILYLLSLVWPIFVLRRLLPASIGMLILVSWTILSAKPKWLNYAVGSIVVVLMLVSLLFYYIDEESQKIPFSKIVQEISLIAEPGDIFVHTSDTSALAFAYYAPDLNSEFLSGDPDYAKNTNRGRAQKIAGLTPMNLEAIIGNQKEFWLVVVMDHNLEYQSDIVESLDQRYLRLTHDIISGVDVIRYRDQG